jgi:EAL domain-containing protein (putative c-di-GMP-specific phosphodiesterase class I)
VAGAADQFMASLDDLRADIEDAQARSFADLRRALWLAAMISVVAIATIAFGPARSFVRRARERDLATGLLRATRFEESLATFARNARPCETYIVGLVPERIDEVRRTLGPVGAAQVLGSLGRRLQRNAGPRALVARSGDALMVAIAAPDVDGAVARTRELLARLDRPIAVGSVQVHTRLYAGVAAIEEGPADIADSPLARAAEAAEQARLTGADVAVREAGAEQLATGFAFEAELLQALRRREFVVHYQPVFNLETWEIIGAEALLRWESPKHGTVGPTLFVPALEACGLIGEVGRWVLETALEDARVFRTVASSGFRLSVNAAAPEVTAPGFVAGVISRMERAGIPPSGLEIEITESVAIADKRLLRAALIDLRDSGIRCSLDDFGTGKSQLADLRELPWDTIKIDRQFVQALPDDRFALSIVRTLVDAAREMGRTVVAEGIETHEQARVMRQLGSQLGQGFLVSKPIPAARLRRLLQAATTGEPRPPRGIVAMAS